MNVSKNERARQFCNFYVRPWSIRSLLCVVAATVGSQASHCHASWSIEPVDMSGQVGWSLAIDTDPTGNPEAAFYTTSPAGSFRYYRRTPSGWQQKGTVDLADAFALDRNGQRFFVNTPGPNYYPQFQTLLDNGLLLGQQLAATRISDAVYLDFDSQNRPQIGWVDTTAQQLKYSFWNGTSWTTRTVASGTPFQYSNSNFIAALDDNDQMHFAWQNSSSRLQYAKPNGTTWTVSSPFPTLNATPYDIDVDARGNVHLAYDVFTGDVFTGGLFYSQYNGTTWTGGRVSGLESFGVGDSKVVADSAGQPHLFTYDSAFTGPKKLKHVFRDNTGAWTNEIIDSYTSTSSGAENIEVTYAANGFHVLYATGNEQIFYAFQPTALPGDFDANGKVDASDYVAWRKGLGTKYVPGDYDTWRANFGRNAGSGAESGSLAAAIPEPAALFLCAIGLCGMMCVRARNEEPMTCA